MRGSLAFCMPISFFAHPYAARERGANENINGLIRQYIPKIRDFTAVSHEHLLWIINRLNHRPRKRFDFQSPFEVFFDHSVALRVESKYY